MEGIHGYPVLGHLLFFSAKNPHRSHYSSLSLRDGFFKNMLINTPHIPAIHLLKLHPYQTKS